MLKYILHDFGYNILITDKILQDRNKLDCKIWLIRPIFVLRTGFRVRLLDVVRARCITDIYQEYQENIFISDVVNFVFPEMWPGTQI